MILKMLSDNLDVSFLPTPIMWYLTLFVIGLSVVFVLPFLTGRRLSITHRKQGWRISLINTRGDFSSNAEQLIRMGFSKVSLFTVFIVELRRLTMKLVVALRFPYVDRWRSKIDTFTKAS